MIYGERPTANLHHDGKGLTGVRIYLCDWNDVDPAPIAGLPHYGDPWSADLPFLRVVDIDADDPGDGSCEYKVQYSTERQLGEEFYETSLEVGVEQVDRTKGYTWETAGTPVTVDLPSYETVTYYNIRMRRSAPPQTAIAAATNKINSKVFHGFPAEHMRFLGAATDETYDLNGNIISVQTSYKFVIHERSHNYEWREPLQARGAPPEYTPLIWQNLLADQPFYTTDDAKIGTPVWTNQVPGHESAISGTAGWDKPKNGDNYRYETCDFAAVLGLPTKLGDG